MSISQHLGGFLFPHQVENALNKLLVLRDAVIDKLNRSHLGAITNCTISTNTD